MKAGSGSLSVREESGELNELCESCEVMKSLRR